MRSEASKHVDVQPALGEALDGGDAGAACSDDGDGGQVGAHGLEDLVSGRELTSAHRQGDALRDGGDGPRER